MDIFNYCKQKFAFNPLETIENVPGEVWLSKSVQKWPEVQSIVSQCVSFLILFWKRLLVISTLVLIHYDVVL